MFTHYESRSRESLGVEEPVGYRLKTYAIHLPGSAFDRAPFDSACPLVEIIWREREAYVQTLLSQDGGGVDAYLASAGGPW